jgi:hypothetical protein
MKKKYADSKAITTTHTCRNESTAGSFGENVIPAHFDLTNSTFASTWNQK